MKPINYDKVFNWRIWWYTKWITGAILVIVIWSIIALGSPAINYFNERAECMAKSIIVESRASWSRLQRFYKVLAN